MRTGIIEAEFVHSFCDVSKYLLGYSEGLDTYAFWRKCTNKVPGKVSSMNWNLLHVSDGKQCLFYVWNADQHPSRPNAVSFSINTLIYP